MSDRATVIVLDAHCVVCGHEARGMLFDVGNGEEEFRPFPLEVWVDEFVGYSSGTPCTDCGGRVVAATEAPARP